MDKKTRPVSGKVKALLVIFSLLATFAVLEIGIRSWLKYFATSAQVNRYTLVQDIDPSAYQWSPHPYLIYYPTPNYQKGLTSHNNMGFRGENFPREKPPGEFRIFALGGSTTYTSSVEDDSKTFPAQLQKVLKEEYGYQDVRVINAGVSGYNSWETLINLTFRIIDLDPDMVIIYHGTNDVHTRIVFPKNYVSDNSGYRKHWESPDTPWFEYSAVVRVISRRFGLTQQVSLRSIVETPKGNSIQYKSRVYETAESLNPDNFQMEILQENLPIYFERNLRSMVALAGAFEFKILLSTWAYSPHFPDYSITPIYQQGYLENNDVVRAVAEDLGAPFFDFINVMPQDTAFWSDGRHVNEKGALLKAQLFAEYINAQGLITR